MGRGHSPFPYPHRLAGQETFMLRGMAMTCSAVSKKMRFYTEIGRFAFLSPHWGAYGQRMMIILGSLESA